MGNIAVIGSKALQLLGFDRKPNDIDLICSYQDAVGLGLRPFYPLPSGVLFGKDSEGTITEIKVAWEGSLEEEFLEVLRKDPETRFIGGYLVPSLNVLYMLKMSHRYLKNSPHFLKTMQDIHWFRDLGCAIPNQWMDFFKRLEKRTYDYPKPSLDQKKKDFFTKESQELYGHNWNHDDLHLAVALYDRPAYEFYKDDLAEVMCSREKFFECSEEIRLAGVYEETSVLALERILIPNDFKPDPEKAFQTALIKVCTSITSGYFREFAWENFWQVMVMNEGYRSKYVQDFHTGVKNGIVKERDY